MSVRLIVIVEGGVVQSIYSDDTNVDIDILDWDDTSNEKQQDELKEEAENLNEVY